MIATKFFTTLLYILLVISVSAQNILQDYFRGNKDSMLVEANRLINMPDPTFKPSSSSDIDTEVLKDMGFDQIYKAEDHYFKVRDNKKLFAYKFPAKSENSIILLHGVGNNAYLYNKTAGLLREATGAEVFAIDLRGHGKSDGKDGDVDYINQYEDDLVDIVKAVRKIKPKGKVIIAGHSMGGGVALNYALQVKRQIADGFILFAPLIGHNSPAIRQVPPTGNDSIEPFMKIHFARIIGLKMFNEVGDHSHDSLPVLFLNLPENAPLRKYTFRANVSSAPEDYKTALQSLVMPTLVFVGDRDEVFDAEAMKKAINENCAAQVEIIEGATHNSVRHKPEPYKLIKEWYKNTFRSEQPNIKHSMSWELQSGVGLFVSLRPTPCCLKVTGTAPLPYEI